MAVKHIKNVFISNRSLKRTQNSHIGKHCLLHFWLCYRFSAFLQLHCFMFISRNTYFLGIATSKASIALYWQFLVLIKNYFILLQWLSQSNNANRTLSDKLIRFLQSIRWHKWSNKGIYMRSFIEMHCRVLPCFLIHKNVSFYINNHWN